MKEHIYKGFVLVRNGTRECPWNVYKKQPNSAVHGEWLGCGYTFKGCKIDIDIGCYNNAE